MCVTIMREYYSGCKKYMNRRVGTNISAAFFTQKQEPKSTPNPPSVRASPSTPFLIKGDESETPAVSTNQGDAGVSVTSDESITVTDSNTSYRFSRATLRENLLELKPFSDLPGTRLPPDKSETFKAILNAMRILYSTPAMYDMVLNDVRNIYSDISEIKPGTVGAFFTGCFQHDNFPGPQGCSPKCASSLPPPQGTPGYSNCDDLVLIYMDGRFNSLNEKRSEHAYVYIKDPDFKAFTTDNVRQLRDAGILRATLIFGGENDTYSQITNPTALADLPMSLDESQVSKVEATQTSSSSSSAATGWIIAIVLILILLLVFVLYMRGT